MTKPRLPPRRRPRRSPPRLRDRRLSSRTAAAAILTYAATSGTNRRPQHLLHNYYASAAPCPNPCKGIDSGFIQIPETNCAEYAQCDLGEVAMEFACQSGLVYDPNLMGCNWAWAASCGPDPECPTDPPTESPTESPVRGTESPTTPSPTTEAPTKDEGDIVVVTDDKEDGSGLLDARPALGGTSSSSPPPPPPPPVPVNPPPSSATTPATTQSSGMSDFYSPVRHPHHAAVWAHVTANKIGISNALLRIAPRRLRGTYGDDNVDVDGLRNYAYLDFYRALRSMSEVGYAVPISGGGDIKERDLQEGGGEGHQQPRLGRSLFYLGSPDSPHEESIVAGLVNVAAFLSQSLGDSISHGSCDELNEDVVDGELPASNACGQYGLSYQDMRCAETERHMECPQLTGGERMEAHDSGGRTDVLPFFCGGKDVFPVTGSAAVVAGRGEVGGPVPNAAGRTDVEGCCWWGRGTINTRGVCQYGKLNYFLGKRAADEGRPARYPSLDFCAYPSSICDTSAHDDPELEWVTGMFRWVDGVQSYDSGGWSYMARLHEFVRGGLTDGMFIHEVSSIVTQGCHLAPCPGVEDTGVEIADGSERWSYFLQALEVLGLPVAALRQSY